MSETGKSSPEAARNEDSAQQQETKDNPITEATAAPTNGNKVDTDLPTVNGDGHESEQDAPADDDRDDSEAETVLSSPVKRREALRRANGVKVDTSSNLNKETKAESTSPTSSKKSVQSSRKVKSEAGSLDDDENDDRSVRSSDADSRTASGSPEQRDGSEPLTNGRGVNNPRKRKHRESSAGRRQSNTDSAKRQRRSSVVDRKTSDRSSEELSPPPRLRRHKRSASGQIKEDAPEGTQGARSRRAASNLPVRDQAKFKSTWDSGSESEVSAKQAQNRSTRSVNRSVSTPGRPMGRDHKRHVNKYGFTRLAEACEAGDLDLVKEWRSKDPEQLEHPEFAGNTPLQVAALNGYPEIVKYLLEEGCNIHCSNSDKDTPLIDAVENEHPDVVKLLLDAGVNPLKQNVKGQQALDLVGENTETASEIRALLRTAIDDWKARGAEEKDEVMPAAGAAPRPGPRQALHFMARTTDNLMKLVVNNDREGVIEFLDARVPVNNDIVAAAARTGDVYLVNMLLAEMSPKKANSRPERPMKAALGTSHFDMVKTLTELDQFDPLYRDRASGNTWYEIAEAKSGPHWEKERDLLFRLYNDAKTKKSRLSSSPVTRRADRFRSPELSDAEMEDLDSPDAAKTKRRLISRKDMRAAASRKSPSTESSRAASSPEAVMKPDEFKLPRRKPGRPRTQSLSSQATDAKAKRIKAAVRENIALFDTGAPIKKRKSEEANKPAKSVSESTKKSNDQANDIDEDTKMTDIKEEEEQKAEAARKEAEELARKQEEETQERERKAREELQALRIEKLDSLPSALKHLLGTDNSDPADTSSFISRKLLPLQAVSGAALDLDGEARDGLWMLNYQAAGILRGAAADSLLKLPTLTDDDQQPLTILADHEVLPAHRASLIVVLGSANLSSDSPELSTPTQTTSDFKAKIAAMKALRNKVHVDTNRFLTMEHLRWINVKDFLSAKAELQTSRADAYPHLQHLPALEVALDACLDDKPFGPVVVKTESPHVGTPGQLIPPSPSTPVLVDEELRKSIGHGLKEGDGRCSDGHLAAIRGMTKVDVVID
ncbi:Ankyrin repeat-containing protein 22 [Elsinoe fawcettii]|nr:Ankyrin repeat-containing protein 22 [Elsinoe fawcettii]